MTYEVLFVERDVKHLLTHSLIQSHSCAGWLR